MSAATPTNARDLVVVADPCGQPNPRLVVAAARAGALGVLDLPGSAGRGLALPAVTRALAEVNTRTSAGFGIRVPLPALHSGTVAPDDLRLPDQVDTVVLAGAPEGPLPAARAWGDRRVLVEVVSAAEAAAALDAGAAGLVAKGSESGGRVGDVEGFVLAQRLAELGRPFWVQGGIGLHTAAAAVAGGATGVVLDGQLALVRESCLDEEARLAVAAMDGSETRVVGGHRIYVRPGLPAAEVPSDAPPHQVAERLGPDLHADLLPLGQDAAAAASLAEQHGTVGGVAQAVREAVHRRLAAAAKTLPLAPGAGVARTHGSTYPIVQGPMTRVSDRAELAAAVAGAGGLPFLALALMPGADARALLTRTAEMLGDRPWGVGILGFVPADVRSAQLDAIQDIRPPVALIAGGRPAQARPLEDAGITTYLHVPSPGLLDRFVREGARRFVFEGRECGGHVGPRASFPLWDAQIERLLAVDDPERLDVLFAGGIHDARSAAMVAALAVPLAERGARVGVLLGTAYLFTREAVSSGAITPTFQEVARSCEATVLLETSPGHATRCVETDYVRAFAARKTALEAAGVPPDEMWAELEALNLGRLRVASKGLVRQGGDLVAVDEPDQRRDGMYMIGQAATLRRDLTTVAELHDEVSNGATAVLEAAAARHRPTATAPRVREPARPVEVAVVGMAAMFPAAADTEQYWANVVGGVDCVTEVPRRRWDPDTFYDPEAVTRDAGRRTPSRWGGFLPPVPFDALTYGIPPRSLASIESVQLLSLEVAQRALADAGYGHRGFDRSRTAVIFGAEGGNDLSTAYGFRAGFPQLVGPLPPELDAHLPAHTEDSFPGVLVNVIAGRIANRLDLGGPNFTVDAACAASLAALDVACRELVDGTSDVVLCGAADVHNGINDYLLFASARALSPTGRCRPFDARADGIALGEGVACVVLKRLADAERDGDRIYAVVEAVAGSSDGRHLGLTAPRQEGQILAVERAYTGAGVSPTRVGLVEAHGTGTVVGDRTELATLTEVFTTDDGATDDGATTGGTVLGSVKSQIGHTKCAAGLAGVIKTARALHAGVLPPTLHVETPNDYYDAKASPFRFLDRPAPWPVEERRAGISAFGFGGTNFHAVLRSHPDGRPHHGLHAWPAELFTVRAPSATAARARLAELRDVVGRVVADDPAGRQHRLRDLARTVCESGSGPIRCAVVADDLADLAAKLETAVQGTTAAGVFHGPAPGELDIDGGEARSGRGKVAFLHPGQGSQRPGMLTDLFVAFPYLQSVLENSGGWVDVMFPGAAFDQSERQAQVEALADTRVAQPALGLAALALTRLLRDLGVEPDMAGGHSYGELAALATAGVFDPHSLLELSRARGEAMAAAPVALGGDVGAMAAIRLPIDELHGRLPDELVIANHNAPDQTVVAGPTAAVDALVTTLTAERIGARRLHVAAAFHSPLVAAASEILAARLAATDVAPPGLAVWSSSTAAPYPTDPDGIRARLTAQLGEPVRFVQQVEAMWAAGARVFVEAGPDRVLSRLVDRILADRPHVAVACDVPGDHGLRRLLLALAELATAGVDLDVRPLFRDRTQRVDLARLPTAAPGWLVDGHLVCTHDGHPVPGSLQPADRIPEVTMSHGPEPQVSWSDHRQPLTTGRDATVQEYLRTGQRLADGQRDVLLRYLGEPATPPLSPNGGAGPAATVELPVARTDLPDLATSGSPDAAVPDDAAPETAAPATEAATSATRSRPRGEELLSTVLTVVGEQMGYPLDMLDPDLDVEADLSIDSIKRVELIGELAERVELPGVDPAVGVDDAVVEELARLKTLRAIASWIDEHAPSGDSGGPDGDGATGPGPTPTSAAPRTAASGPTPPTATADGHPPVPATARRHEIEPVTLTPALPTVSLAGQAYAIVGERWKGLDSFRHRLEEAGATVEVLATHRGTPARPLPDELAERLAEVQGAVHLGAADPGEPVDARDVFAALKPAVTGQATTLVAAVAPAPGPPSAVVSGVPGLMRSLAHELPDRHVRSVELPPTGSPDVAARLLADEVLDPDGPASVTYRDGGRATLRPGAGMPLAADAPALPLDRESVVVVTGGARGITARATVELARRTACTVALLGRSPLPGEEEDPRTAAARDRRALRQALAEVGKLRTPGEIEAACDRTLAAREIRATLAALDESGRAPSYHQVDVRDPDALVRTLDEVRTRHRRIDAIVHGAGVLDDCLAADKTDAGFDRVFGTKVDAARTLLAHLGDDVRLVMLFGSVSGVFGNRGQVDYAAANDALDELARRFDGVDGRRVLSVDWGPWAGAPDDVRPGMVSPELEREYARRGIGLLDPDEGVRALLAEMATPLGDAPQVVVMRAEPRALELRRDGTTGTGTAGPARGAGGEPVRAGEADEPRDSGLTLEALTRRG